jgi:hypothetical protein
VLKVTGVHTDPKIAYSRSVVGKHRAIATKYERNQQALEIELKNKKIFERIS